MSKRISQWELVDHGIDGSQYFQGCGTSFTDYDYCVTGCGDTPAEAFEDMLEMLAQTTSGIDVSQLRKDILDEEGLDKMPDKPSAWEDYKEANPPQLEDGDDDEEYYDDLARECDNNYYLSLLYNIEDADNEPDAPEGGDLTITDYTNFYQDGKLVLCTLRGCYMPDSENEQDEWKRHVKAYMEAEQFWPNVWFISDHGNAHLIDMNDEKPADDSKIPL